MSQFLESSFQYIGSALDIVQSLLKLKTDQAVSSKVIELNGVILGLQREMSAARADYSSARDRIAELEKETVALRDWESEKQRYVLEQIDTATFVYRRKESMEDAEPVHRICTHCYQNSFKSILQRGNNRRILLCPRCKTEFIT